MESYFFCDFCLYNVKNQNPLSVTGMSKILLRPARACSRPLSCWDTAARSVILALQQGWAGCCSAAVTAVSTMFWG